MATFHTVIMVALAALAQGQRPSFAGSRPIGFPELPDKPTTTVDPLGNRFGETGTTERLPIEANGDRDLIDRISKFPIDKQPFWYLNWKALEEHRKKPQTFPQRPSQFGETPNLNTNTGTLNSNSGTLNSNSGNLNSNSGLSSNAVPSNSGTLSSGVSSLNVDLGNRNGGTDTNVNTGQKEVSMELRIKDHNVGALNSEVPSSNVDLGNRHGGIDINGQKKVNSGFQNHHNAGALNSEVPISNVDLAKRNSGIDGASTNVNSGQKQVNAVYQNHQRYSTQSNGFGNHQFYRAS